MSIETRFPLPQKVEVGAVQEQQAHGLRKIPWIPDRIENQREAQSTGSTAVSTGKFIGWFGSVPEWLMGADCKSAGSAYVGSNPTRPTFPHALVAQR